VDEVLLVAEAAGPLRLALHRDKRKIYLWPYKVANGRSQTVALTFRRSIKRARNKSAVSEWVLRQVPRNEFNAKTTGEIYTYLGAGPYNGVAVSRINSAGHSLHGWHLGGLVAGFIGTFG